VLVLEDGRCQSYKQVQYFTNKGSSSKRGRNSYSALIMRSRRYGMRIGCRIRQGYQRTWLELDGLVQFTVKIKAHHSGCWHAVQLRTDCEVKSGRECDFPVLTLQCTGMLMCFAIKFTMLKHLGYWAFRN
jgi:hypothetical protein